MQQIQETLSDQRFPARKPQAPDATRDEGGA
jgi:hypothetical protein